MDIKLHDFGSYQERVFFGARYIYICIFTRAMRYALSLYAASE